MQPNDFYITPDDYLKAAQNGIARKTLEARIRNYGWDKNRAINTPPQQRNPSYSREEWELAKQNGIPHDTFRNRINKLGWDVMRAATEPPNDPKVFTTGPRPHRRKYSDEIRQQMEANGIPYATFIMRISSGWSVEEAATRAIVSNREKGLLAQAKRRQRRL